MRGFSVLTQPMVFRSTELRVTRLSTRIDAIQGRRSAFLHEAEKTLKNILFFELVLDINIYFRYLQNPLRN